MPGPRSAGAGVVDTVGAGDAFGAALCVGLLRGCSPDLIVENANRLAAYVCSRPGAVPKIPATLMRSLTI
jgi:fructokinase